MAPRRPYTAAEYFRGETRARPDEAAVQLLEAGRWPSHHRRPTRAERWEAVRRLELGGAGLSAAQIADRVGTSSATVHRLRRALRAVAGYRAHVCACRWCGRTMPRPAAELEAAS